MNIYNGTPKGVPQDVKGQLLPINQLKGNPPTEDCSVSNVHRCKDLFHCAAFIANIIANIIEKYAAIITTFTGPDQCSNGFK